MDKRLIFLDLDGVLSIPATHFRDFDETCSKRLKTIMEKTKASIVISSSWRKSYSLRKLQDMLFKVGIVNVIDVTGFEEAERGIQIDNWLKKHPEVTSFVILDDDSWDMDPHKDKLVVPKTEIGLEDKHIKEAIDILERQR
jgi:hypothetical protein